VSLSANWLIYLFFQRLFGPIIEGEFFVWSLRSVGYFC
jgi:hypothetical protein